MRSGALCGCGGRLTFDLACCGRPGPAGAHAVTVGAPGADSAASTCLVPVRQKLPPRFCETFRSDICRKPVTKRAARARTQTGGHSRHRNRPHRARPAAATKSVGAPCEVPRSAEAVASARSALRPLACGGCLNEALKARSEFRRVATVSSIAGEPVLCTGRLAEAPGPGGACLGYPHLAAVHAPTANTPAKARKLGPCVVAPPHKGG